jgi:hypothetical protein
VTVGPAATGTALTLSAATVTYGNEQTEHLSVTVTPQYPGPAPAGTVTVKESTTTLCTITLSSGKGSCSLSAKQLRPGTYHVAAYYAGSANFRPSTSAQKTLTIAP